MDQKDENMANAMVKNSLGALNVVTNYLMTNYPVEATLFALYAATVFLIATAFTGNKACNLTAKIVSIFVFCVFLLIAPIHRCLDYYRKKEYNVNRIWILLLDMILRVIILFILMLTVDLRPFSCFIDDAIAFRIGALAIAVTIFMLHPFILMIQKRNEQNSDTNNDINHAHAGYQDNQQYHGRDENV